MEGNGTRKGSLTGSVRRRQPAQGTPWPAPSTSSSYPPGAQNAQKQDRWQVWNQLTTTKVQILSKNQPILTQLDSKPPLSPAHLFTEPQLQLRYQRDYSPTPSKASSPHLYQ